MRTSPKGIDLIRKHEGLRLEAYLCPAKVWTIGYGHTSAAGEPTVVKGMKITRAEAVRILERDLRKFENAVNRLVKVPLSQMQFDALVSFVFNVGEGAFAKSTLLRKLNQRRYGEVPAEFMRWVNAGGKPMEGLVRRRRDEAGLFRNLSDHAQPAPMPQAVDEPPPQEIPPAKSGGLWAALTTFLTGAGGLGFLGSINNPFALGALALVLVAGGVAGWLVLSGRVEFKRVPT